MDGLSLNCGMKSSCMSVAKERRTAPLPASTNPLQHKGRWAHSKRTLNRPRGGGGVIMSFRVLPLTRKVLQEPSKMTPRYGVGHTWVTETSSKRRPLQQSAR